MSLIIRNLNCICASGLQTLVETARGAVWVGTVFTQMAPRAISTSVCKPEAQIQLRFLMMSDITLETCWTIDISGIINSVTELHLVGDLLLVILWYTVPWILKKNIIADCYKFKTLSYFSLFLQQLHKLNTFLENVSVSLSMAAVILLMDYTSSYKI
jgi:hypothetical protein